MTAKNSMDMKKFTFTLLKLVVYMGIAAGVLVAASIFLSNINFGCKSGEVSLKADRVDQVYSKVKTEESLVFLECKGLGVNKAAVEPDPRGCDGISKAMIERYEDQREFEWFEFCTKKIARFDTANKDPRRYMKRCRKFYPKDNSNYSEED